jgi:hypothetical protein
MTRRSLLGVLAMTAVGQAGPPIAGARETPLALLLRSHRPSYPLDLGGRTAAQFLAAIEAGLRHGGPIPAPPAVELVAEVQNQGTAAVELWVSGDPVVLDLEVQGPGARTVEAPLAFTSDWRPPRPRRLRPGERHVYEIRQLSSGWRGSVWHYWTAPGTYRLTASLRTGLGPAPRDAHRGSATLRLTSPTVDVEVR